MSRLARVFGLVASFLASGCAPKPASTPAKLDDRPLTISVRTTTSKERLWELHVDSVGTAELTISASPLPSGAANGPVRKQFQVTKEQLTEFCQALADERFFELAGDYGQRVPDCHPIVLTVAAGRQTHTVRVHFLGNWVAAKDKNKLREPARVVRLLDVVLGWVEPSEVWDMREYGRKVLDAAKE